LAVNPNTSLLCFGRETCGVWEISSRREWLVANGIGGFACGTIAQANTRRYHGLLIASLQPPVERVMLLSKLDIVANYLGNRYELAANEFEGGTISPQGFAFIQSFELCEGIPTWVFACADALLRQQVYMAPGKNTTYVSLTLLRATAPMHVQLTPLCAWRDYHCQNRGPQSVALDAEGSGCCVRIGQQVKALRMRADRGGFEAGADWYWNFYHRTESERGLDAVEDLLMPGRFRSGLQQGETLLFSASCEDTPPAPADDVLAEIACVTQNLRSALPDDAPDWLGQLAIASDQFIVQRGPAIPGSPTGAAMR
jgi:predicted glycogen debranching enzyme